MIGVVLKWDSDVKVIGYRIVVDYLFNVVVVCFESESWEYGGVS